MWIGSLLVHCSMTCHIKIHINMALDPFFSFTLTFFLLFYAHLLSTCLIKKSLQKSEKRFFFYYFCKNFFVTFGSFTASAYLGLSIEPTIRYKFILPFRKLVGLRECFAIGQNFEILQNICSSFSSLFEHEYLDHVNVSLQCMRCSLLAW